MKHLCLFSGIGGFSLAARWAGIETIGMCEIGEFQRKVLKKNFPGVTIERDIKQLNGGKYDGVDIVSGGFPCQPFSVAGKRNGIEDDRDLWPEMFRVIKQAKPTYVIAENVAGFTNMAFRRTKLDLENQGYYVQPFIIPACAKNAQHRRDRLWIIAHNNGKRGQGSREKKIYKEQRLSWSENERGVKNFVRRPDLHEPKLCGKGNGVSQRLDTIGNAIVPQIAYEIFMAILENEGLAQRAA